MPQLPLANLARQLLKTCSQPVRYWVAGWALMALAVGCNVINPAEPIPGYLTVEKPLLVLEGDTVEAGIRDVWMFQFPDYSGTFELPARIPFTDLSRTQFLLRGGILSSGNENNRIMYPFWRFDTLVTTLRAGELTVYQPIFRYLPDTAYTVAYSESFDAPSVSVQHFGSTDDSTTLLRTRTDAYQGVTSAYAVFDTRRVNLQYVTINAFPLPGGDNEVFLEYSYKGNMNPGFGLIVQNQGIEQVQQFQVNAQGFQTDKWQRVYVRLTDYVRQQPSTATYKLYFVAVNEDKTERRLYLDYIRILHFR